VFATVRHRTVRMKGALSQDTARLMVFKLVMAASRTWRRLQGQNQLPKVVYGIKFKDGIEAVAEIKSAAWSTPSPTFPRSSERCTRTRLACRRKGLARGGEGSGYRSGISKDLISYWNILIRSTPQRPPTLRLM
jgi:hypothetical protein